MAAPAQKKTLEVIEGGRGMNKDTIQFPTTLEPFVATPHRYYESGLFGAIDSLSELKVTEAIIRQTFGWHKTEDEISFSQFMTLTQLSRPMVREGIEKGIARGSINRRQIRNSFIYSLNLDVDYEKKTSTRGKHLNGKSVHSMNQFIDLTSSDTEPLSVNSLNRSGEESVHSMNTQKKDSKENIKKEIMAHSRPSGISIEDYYKDLLKRIETKTNVPLTATGNKKTAAGVLTEMITEIWGGENDVPQVGQLAKDAGGVWRLYEFILKQPSKAPNGNVVSWLMACLNNNKGNGNGRNQLGRAGTNQAGKGGDNTASGPSGSAGTAGNPARQYANPEIARQYGHLIK